MLKWMRKLFDLSFDEEHEGRENDPSIYWKPVTEKQEFQYN